MSDTTFHEVSEKVRQHIAERGWDTNPPRGLAISLLLEASELLEHYQWDDTAVSSTDELAEELADILIYAFQFAHTYDIDIPAAIDKKLAKAAKKYPVAHFSSDKSVEERRKAWYQDKLNHKKSGL